MEITATHPLEPLSAAEMKAAHEIITTRFADDPDLPDELRFPLLVLSEPPKVSVLAWHAGDPFPRMARAEVMHSPSNRTWVALVDLRHAQLTDLRQVPAGAQPAITAAEYGEADAIVRAHQPWRETMRARGQDPDLAYLDVWAPGDGPLPAEVVAALPSGRDTRLLRLLSFDRGAPLEVFDPRAPQNPYDRPVEGVVATVDMNGGRVVHLTDTVVRPVATGTGNAKASVTPKPLRTEQPDGSDIARQGRLVRWHNWQFYAALHPREGLVLYDVRFADRGTLRPVAYRMSLSEIFVFYGLGEENWAWRSALDVGEYNAGTLAQTLEVNRDVPDNAEFLDATFFGDTGPDPETPTGTYTLPASVALYERDAGILWSRTDPSNAARDTRQARELVVTWNCWIGNYIYGFDWVFGLDGSIEVQTLLTGATLNRGADATREASAPLVAIDAGGTRTSAPVHQHFLNFRLDLDVDGPPNRIMEMEVAPLPGTGFANAFAPTMQQMEREGFRDADPFAQRHWHVEGARSNALGGPTSYALEPGGGAVPYAAPDFGGLERAGFASHPLWLTRYREGELYAAGAFPSQGDTPDGLPEFVRDAASLHEQDVVVWYTAGLTHISRPEDFPVMPAETISFRVVPRGFFDRNPALEVADQDG